MTDGGTTAEPPSPDPGAANRPPRKRITTERRERPFRWGIGVAVSGLVVAVVGGVLSNAVQATEVLAASARAEVPDVMRFDADRERYAIVLLPEPIAIPKIGNSEAELSCEITHADGTTATVEGRRQTVSLDSALGQSVGGFDSPGGPTEVACSFTNWPSTSGYFASVAPEHQGTKWVGLGLIIAGLVLMACGVVAIIVGVRGRMVVTDAT